MHPLQVFLGRLGPDALEDHDHLVMDIAAMVREVVLRQNAYHPHDAISSPQQTYALARAALDAFREGERALASGTLFSQLDLTPTWRSLVALRDGTSA